MSVLIKGIKMPENCSECPLEYDQMMCSVTGYVWFDQDYLDIGFDSTHDRLPECPLVELPERHGRLIDEQEIRNGMNRVLTQPQRPTWNDTYNAIQEMDAVIEAEGTDE